MHQTKCRGARDLSVVKFAAPYDSWRSKQTPKNENHENHENVEKIFNYLKGKPMSPKNEKWVNVDPGRGMWMLRRKKKKGNKWVNVENTKRIVKKKTKPCNKGKSLLLTARIAASPIPGQAKIVSTRTAPVKKPVKINVDAVSG